MTLGVKPCFISSDHMLYCADGVNNGILVRCKNAGDVLFSGLGAGPIPTATAVIYDVAEAMSGVSKNYRFEAGTCVDAGKEQTFLALYDGINGREGAITGMSRVKELEAHGVRPAALYEVLK